MPRGRPAAIATFTLVPTRIRARRQDGALPAQRVKGEEATEGADPAEHLGAVGGADGLLDQPDRAVALVDVDAGIRVAQISHLRGQST